MPATPLPDQNFAIDLRPQGVSLRGVQLHWVDDVQLTETGMIERADIGSVLKAVDAIGNPLEIQCVTSFTNFGQNIVFDARVPLNPSCVVNSTPSPMNTAKFSVTEWYPHAGNVNKYAFHNLYDAVDVFLT